MSTFSGLSTAYSGLAAARAGLDITGQNIANANTPGYTRQRLETSSVAATPPSMFTQGTRAGEGVLTQGVARLGDAHLDARVRITAGTAGYAAVRAQAYSNLETGLREPGEQGVSDSLNHFWAGWSELSTNVDLESSAAPLLSAANELTSRISTGYREVENQWASLRSSTEGLVAEVNGAAGQVAELNRQIRSATAAGTSANELIDRRTMLTADIAGLTGATVRNNDDGTTDVLIAGGALVSGTTARSLQVSGPTQLGSDAAVQVEWTQRPGVSAGVESGELAGALSLLAPVASGGALAQAAAGYDSFAEQLAGQVNGVLAEAGKPPFFTFAAGRAAATLTVAPTTPRELITGLAEGGFNGTLTDKVSQLSTKPGSPDASWSAFVTGLGAAARVELRGNKLAEVSATSAVQQQLGAGSVSMDEEQLDLLKYQHAYQGAARVMTAIDEMLDVLINRMGIVGR
ncbi:hypothetical protein AC792_02995 [Arthrobacter sp. RIT-PI-e]|uniref:flagellar hook-associated protein FlgK n=1 Tax=Arthrobacter sp. RIT-PI-e TaxID=1681197 RepID=UPI0006761DB5|nr:flagellar hook-associated protein FlgK [Arthrobacter sp. RIT-PI-e]KNC20030.1 hypothetical protein AC792_02995 [Arthrobacter sp. RIT-PI-e]